MAQNHKIASQTISHEVIQRAKRLVGDEHCKIALELIGYNDELENAMKYVFGSSFICSDMNSAKQVAFDKNIRTKSVTLDGEVFNPSGLLTGGSSHRGLSILENMKQFQEKQILFNQLTNEINELQIKLDEYYKRNQENEELKQKIDILTHELQVIKDRINDSTFH